MVLICLFLCSISLTTARVYPRTEANDVFKVFDGVEGIIYDIPEYQDPAVSLFKLIAKGIMPVYTTRDVIESSKDSFNKNDKPHYQTDDIKKGLDTVIAQLQTAKNKLENGNNGIYLDIDKSVLSLENMKHHLYLDLETVDGSAKQSDMSDVATVKSSTKVSAHVYPILRATMKKYLFSDDPIFKYYSHNIPTEESSFFDNFADSLFDFDAALVPYSPKDSSAKHSSTDDDDDSDEQVSESNSSQDQSSQSGAEQLLTFDATTDQTVGFDKGVFQYNILGSEVPPIGAPLDEMKLKPYVVDDIVSSAELLFSFISCIRCFISGSLHSHPYHWENDSFIQLRLCLYVFF